MLVFLTTDIMFEINIAFIMIKNIVIISIVKNNANKQMDETCVGVLLTENC